jgi:hypothetical protein
MRLMIGRTKTRDAVLETKKPKASFPVGTSAVAPSYACHGSRTVQLHRTLGNQAMQRLFTEGAAQTELKISQPNDTFEQEADRTADRVMGKTGKTPALKPPRKTSLPSLTDSGRPLSTAEREFFEPRFGADFGGVRIHASDDAGRLSRGLGAEAFTLGPNIYLAPESYREATSAGRSLLAHELTHVLQQTGGQPSSATIQRKLLVTGKRGDVGTLLDLLEPASGFTLKYDPKTHEVSITASRLKPPSPVLAGRLAEIIGNPDQDAELNLGRRQPGVGFGAFPFSGPLVQKIDIEDMARLEAKAHGSGVAFLIHEIVENYQAHSAELRDFNRQIVFSVSHEKALEAEMLVAGELVGRRGGRVADSVVTMGRSVIRKIDDYENYFLVIDYKRDTLVAARQVSRVNVSTHMIRGFTGGSLGVPSAARKEIAAIVDNLAANPTATVLIKSGDRDTAVARQRAEKVQEEILAAGKGRKGFHLRSWRNFHLVNYGLIDLPGSSGVVIVTIDKPDIETEKERGRLVKRILSGRKRK